MYSFLMYLGNKSEVEKQVKTMTRKNNVMLKGDRSLCITNQSITPATAIIYVGDSDPELNKTKKSSVDAKIIS